jgi:hypothetical protein
MSGLQRESTDETNCFGLSFTLLFFCTCGVAVAAECAARESGLGDAR